MSTLSPAPRHVDRDSSGAGTPSRGLTGPAGLVLTLLIGIGLAAVAIITSGGSDLGPNTVVEIVLLGLGAGAGATVILSPSGGRRDGAATLGLFALVAALTAASVAWSVTPDLSWVEAGRTLGYVCAFGVAVAAARTVPRSWRHLVGGLAVAAIVVCGWAVIVKALDLPTDGQPGFGRLLAPFGYWNATGLAAALGLPPTLSIAAGRRGSAVTRGLAVSGLTLLIVTAVLSDSRSAVLGAILGLAVTFVLGHNRLRCALALGVAAAVAAAVCAWAITDHTVSHYVAATATRASADRLFGIVLIAGLVLAGVAGSRAVSRADRTELSEPVRRRIGAGLLGLVGVVPLVIVCLLAVSSRGLTGEVSHIVSTLTSSHAHIVAGPGRLVAVASTRPTYWRQGISVAVHHLLLGAGAGSFGVAHLRYPTARLSPIDAAHAHSYVVETFADFGIVGLVLNALLLLAWLGAARRTLRPAPEETMPGKRMPGERDGLVALAGVVVAFGTSSALDWTWFFPGVTIPALVAAGWLAGRGAPGTVRDRRREGRAVLERPAAILGLTLLLAATLVLAFFVWQPLRSEQADNAAGIALADRRPAVAVADARAAEHEDPVSLSARAELAAIDSAALGEVGRGRAELTAATRVQSENPQAWSDLGQYELWHHEPRLALGALRRSAALDPTNAATLQLISDARSESRRP